MWVLQLLTVFLVSLLVWFLVVAAVASTSEDVMEDPWRSRLMTVAVWAIPLASISTLGAWLATLGGERCSDEFCQTWPPAVQYAGTAALGAFLAVVTAFSLIAIVAALWDIYCDWAATPKGRTRKMVKRFLVGVVLWPYWLGRAAWRTISPP